MRKLLIRNGKVLSMDPMIGDVEQADILVIDGKIAQVAPGIEEVADCDVIDALGMVVLPGLVDTHRHLWQTALRGIASDWTLMEYLQHMGTFGAKYKPEDVYIGNLLGAIETLDAGITTVFDWSHIMNTPEHADEAIRGLKESGTRAVFAHGNPGTDFMAWFYESKLPHPTDVRRVREQHFSSDDQLVTMAMAIRGPEYSIMEVTRQDLQLARELGLRISMHVGGGTFGPHYKPVEKLYHDGLLGSDINFAHACTLSDQEYGWIAETGGSISITPEVEMQMALGFPATRKALTAAVKTGLGVDVVTGVGGDLFAQMRFALQTDRALHNQSLLEQGEMPGSVSLEAREVLKMATIDGAQAIGMDHKIGSITPGKEADIILLSLDSINLYPVHHLTGQIVLGANRNNVDTVIVKGRTLKRNGRMIHPLIPLRTLARESMQSITQTAMVEKS